MKGILGKKLGMTRIYDGRGRAVPVTVVEAGPCTVLGLRTQERNGYSAVQLGWGRRKASNVSKAVRGQLTAAKLDDSPPALIREIRLDRDSELAVGAIIGAGIFAAGELVDVTGVTKGKGTQGVVRRWHFSGGRGGHGGVGIRRPGSIGCRERPGKIHKNKRMAGHLGGERLTIQGLRVVQVRDGENVLLIKGAVPGPNGNFVMVRASVKIRAQRAAAPAAEEVAK